MQSYPLKNANRNLKAFKTEVDFSIKCLIVQMIFGRTVHVTLVVRLGIKVLGLEFSTGLTIMIMMWSMVNQEKYTLITTATCFLIKEIHKPYP
jgi:hypothetical protein